MLLLLQTRGQVSASQLSDEFEVSVRTVYRDVEALSAAGVPVYTERGRTGGIAILPGFRTDATGLTSEEARSLFALVNEPGHDDLGIGEALKSALRKLMAALPEAQQGLAERSMERIIVDSTQWGDGQPALRYLNVVQEAVLTDRRIRLSYERRNSAGLEDLPVVDAHGLVHRSGSWYLVTTVNGVDRQFRVDRIHHAELLDAPVQRPKGYRLTRAWQALDEAWRREYARLEVHVRVGKDALGLFQRVMAAEIVDPVDRHTAESTEWTELTLRMRSFGHAQTLLAFGNQVVVTGPPALVENLADTVRELATIYPTGAVRSGE
ncbi:helix-turn-helix transcriptional regulator [Corynebacterium nuruki]|uniref:helix-turn-helix transcriptional regulator n=1 Tax=Corynebacterium nuruki TaxID=1032851 RepID=UPI0039BFA8D9